MATTYDNILIMAFAGDCGHCKTFKEKYLKSLETGLKSEVKNLGILKLENEKLNSELDYSNSRYPAHINNYIAWYPIFILIPGRSFSDKDRFQLSVYNGYLNNDGKVTAVDPPLTQPISPGSIIKWVNNELMTNPIFTGGRKTETVILPPVSGLVKKNDILENKPTGKRFRGRALI